MKKCFKCSLVKPLSCFYKHSQMADGHLNKCKECTKRDVRENRQKKLDRYRAYDRERHYEGGPRGRAKCESSRAAKRRWRMRNREKSVAHAAAGRALKRGAVRKPRSCESCGNERPLQAHHHDYSKPLDVIWLCPGCHGAEHRRYTREENRRILDAAHAAED